MPAPPYAVPLFSPLPASINPAAAPTVSCVSTHPHHITILIDLSVIKEKEIER
jgi:hypothetical protein